MTKNDDDVLPVTTPTETAIDVAAIIGSAVPWIGGPVSSVLGGMTLGRKLGRVREVLEGLSNELNEFQSDVSENYVKTEEFEDILEQTLRRVGDERSEEKRWLYKAFLADIIVSPGESYDDQLRMLRTFEKLTSDHLHILKALMQEPNPNPSMMGSPNQTLRERLPNFEASRIEEMIKQLNDMRVTKLVSLKVMMTGHGAQNLKHNITEYGWRIINYINMA